MTEAPTPLDISMGIEDHLDHCLTLRDRVEAARSEVARLEIELHVAEQDFRRAVEARLDSPLPARGYLMRPGTRAIYEVGVSERNFTYEKTDSL